MTIHPRAAAAGLCSTPRGCGSNARAHRARAHREHRRLVAGARGNPHAWRSARRAAARAHRRAAASGSSSAASTSPSTATTSWSAPAVHRGARTRYSTGRSSVRPRREDLHPRRRCPLDGTNDPRGHRRLARVRPPRTDPARRADRSGSSRAPDPTGLRRQERSHGARRARPRRREIDGEEGLVLVGGGREMTESAHPETTTDA